MIWMLDSDTIIFLIRGSKPNCKNPAVRKKAQAIEGRCKMAEAARDELALSSISLCELEFGIRHSGQYQQEKAALENILFPFKVYPFDATTSPEHFGRIREELQQRGQMIGVFDLLIAAHALSVGATLVTNNQAHFQRVTGLHTVNWS